MREVTANGYEELRDTISSTTGRVFVLFSGSKIDGKSWCPDCEAAELLRGSRAPVSYLAMLRVQFREVIISGESERGGHQFVSCYFQLCRESPQLSPSELSTAIFSAEPVIESAVSSEDVKSLDATFITCYVGERDYWKNPACPFRTDPAFKLTCVPTLIEKGKKHKRLTEGQLTDEGIVKDFFSEDS